MHPSIVKQEALDLIAAGVNDCEVARRPGIARTTVRDWRRPTYAPAAASRIETCQRCWRAMSPVVFGAADYAMLLGLYLGDGCISGQGRTCSLRITLDSGHPTSSTCAKPPRRGFPFNCVNVVPRKRGSCGRPSCLLLTSALPLPAGWCGQEAPATDGVRGLADRSRDLRALGLLARPDLVGRLQLFEQDGSLRVPVYSRTTGTATRWASSTLSPATSGTSGSTAATALRLCGKCRREAIAIAELCQRMWRNWQTRGLQVSVSYARGGSSPLIRM